MPELLTPIKPGEILLEEFLCTLNIKQNQFARDIDVPVSRIADIIKAKRSITPDTALRFSHAFGTSPEFWLNLQMSYDLKNLRRNDWHEIEPTIESYVSG